MKRSRCLVLGANGFIGSHLVDELAKSGYIVRAFDRFKPSDPIKFVENDKIEILAGDIYNTNTLKKSLKGVDYVFHCFSATTPHSSEDNPFADIDKNLIPSIAIFNECVEQHVKKVIYLSSGGAIYGVSENGRSSSEDDVPAPVSPYGIIKQTIENYLAYFKRKHGLEFIVYRMSNPYGPRQAFRNNQGVIPAFIAQIREVGEIKVFGDGNASRDFIYIRDATKMIVDSFAKLNNRPTYNIGSGVQTTLNEIILNLRANLHKNFKVTHLESPKTFLKHTSISVELFKNEFGICAGTDIKKGIAQTLATTE